MFLRLKVSTALALLFCFLFIAPVFAGGWAVITLDALPTNVVAEQPYTIGFTVLQHGKTPMDGLHPTIRANLYKDEEFIVEAKSEGEPGHYVATLTFPKEGDWSWSIQAFTMDQTMPILKVAPATGAAMKAEVEKKPVALPWMLILGLTLVATLVSATFAFRQRSRPATVLTAIFLIAGVALSITEAGEVSRVEAQSKSELAGLPDPSISQVEWGRELFVAKGCITCHYNSEAASSENTTIEMGAPDLSKFSAVPEVLRLRLNDPSSVKSDTQMPKLTLSDAEIEALIAFINSK